jgi:hypothetical protein
MDRYNELQALEIQLEKERRAGAAGGEDACRKRNKITLDSAT